MDIQVHWQGPRQVGGWRGDSNGVGHFGCVNESDENQSYDRNMVTFDLRGQRVGEERLASASPPNVVSAGPVEHSQPQFCALVGGALCWPRTRCSVGPEGTTISGSGYLPRPPRTSP